jgi:hypothetical protein
VALLGVCRRRSSRGEVSGRWRIAVYLTPILVCGLVTIAAAPLSAQDEGTPTQLWLNYQFQQKVGEKSRVFGTLSYEELMSRENFWGEWNRLAIRGGGSVDLGSRFRVALGGDLRYTYRREIDDLFEFRLWQEGTAFWPERTGGFRRWVLVHRLRIEERITESDGWGFAMRLRYRLEIKIPLNKYTLEPKTFYLPLAVEFFADIVNEVPEYFARQNRATVGLGYVINKNWTVDLRYHRQRSRSTIDDDFKISNNVIDFSVKTSFRIRDLVKGR